jgi:hypothetical protein
MWYNAGNGIDHANIGYATSVDGVSWDRHPTPVMVTGEAGTWYADTIGPGTVIKEDGVFKMWFFGGVGGILGADANTKTGIGYATSPDGLNWSFYDDPATTAPPYQFSDPVLNHGEAGAWDANEMFTPGVLRTDAGGYEMWYSGWREGLAGNYIGYATSPDGITWTKHPENPIANWSSGLGFPRVILDAGEYRMWYMHLRWRESTADIKYATSPVVTGISTSGGVVPGQHGIELHQNHPNPFVGRTRITYELPEATEVRLTLLDAIGRSIRVLDNGRKSAGMHTITLDPSDMVPGVYFYRLDGGSLSTARSMVILK